MDHRKKTCAGCEYDNEEADTECCMCGEPLSSAVPSGEDDVYRNIVAGVVVGMEPVAGKDKLHKCRVTVGSEGETLTIVTNAVNVVEGCRVVVAKPGAIVDGDVVKKAVVGGVASEGMLCDAPALGWKGGGAGVAALLPDTFLPGQRPPDSRPRLK